ncbi:MAG: proton-conducting transporter membrane subunit [Candidatus Izemoplasmatales bacterium]|nr:proton-conducting transporter membrane subunit [Candidatus Izemoplasmatales bacterium]
MNAVLLIAIPLLAAFLSILSKKFAPYLLLLVGLVNVVLIFFVPYGIVVIGGFELPFGINLLFDTYSKIALFLVNGLFLVVTFLNFKEYNKLSSVLLVALAGLNGLLLTGDLFNLFVFLEIAGIAGYLITTTNKKPASTMHYLVIGSVGSSLYLFGLIILYSMFGTLNMMDMIHQIQVTNVAYTNLVLPFFLMFVGLGVEAKLLPFNSWVKGILKHSNTLSGPMVASIYAATISFVFGRIISNLFVFEGKLLTVVTVLLVMGIVIGEAMAFSSSKAREILLFSSISQASIVVLLFVNGIVLWAVYLIIANALSKTILFLIINKAVKTTNDDSVDALQGIFANNLLVGLSFTAAALSIMGLPLFVGFIIKLNFLTELVDSGQLAIVGIILIASVVEGVYFIKLLLKLWFKGEKEVEVKFNLSYKVVVIVFAALMIAFGTYSAPLHTLDNSIDSVAQEIEVIYHG